MTGRRPAQLASGFPAPGTGLLAKLCEANRDGRSDRHEDDGDDHRRGNRCGLHGEQARARIPGRERDRLRGQSTYDWGCTHWDWRPRPRLNVLLPCCLLHDADAHPANSRRDLRA